MLPNELRLAVETLTDEQLRELTDLVMYTEPVRRRREAAMADTIDTLRQSGELEAPKTATIEPDKELTVSDVPTWVDPGTLHSKMYTRGNVVRHRNRIWESTHPGLNHWEPGAQGVDYRIWRDITDEVTKPAGDTDAGTPGAAADGVIPFKDGLDLKAGDVVLYQGAQYRVVQPHTSQWDWTPPAVPALFSRL